METEQRRIVELQEKKLTHLKKYSNNVIQSIIKSKMLEMLENNTSFCLKKTGYDTKSDYFIKCLNKRYELSEMIIEVLAYL